MAAKDKPQLSALPPLHPERLLRDFTSRTVAGKFPEGGTYNTAGVFCPVCATDRRVVIQLVYWQINGIELTRPLLAEVACLQCQTWGAIVVYEGPTGTEVAVHWPKFPCVATASTPASVAYYLEQAGRCESVQAYSAAAAMYRAALDHLMFDHGYKTGMLGKRIEKLIDDVEAGKAPDWARDLDRAYLDVIKNLGDGAIHTNDGDVSRQDTFRDPVLFDGIHETFAEILDRVYERPARNAARLQKMQEAAAKVGKPTKTEK